MTASASALPRSSPADLRRTKRDLVDFSTRATGRSGVHDLKIINVSPFGLMARAPSPLQPGDRLLVELPHIRSAEAIVRWAEGGRIGTEFSHGIDAEDYAAMLEFMPRRGAIG